MTTLLDAARGVIETRQPTVAERRDALRRLATYPDDHDQALLSVLVGALVDPALPRTDRQTGWEDLEQNCALLTALGTGGIEPQVIAPHAVRAQAHTVAEEILEADIAEALGRLVADAPTVPCRSGHTDCTVDCGWCKGTGREQARRESVTA